MTKIESLDIRHPGLLEAVKNWLLSHHGGDFSGLQAMLAEQYGERVAISTLSSFYQLRVLPQRMDQERSKTARLAELDAVAEFTEQRRIYRDAIQQADLLIEETSENPNGDAAEIIRYFLKAAIFQQRRALETSDPLKLLQEDRKREELLQRQQEIEIEKGKLQVALQNAETAAKEAEARLAAQRQAVRQAADEAERKLGKGESITLEDINRIRERTFGLPPIQGGEAAGDSEDPAVPEPLD